MRSILLAGATGLVGGHVLRRLLRHPAFHRVVTIGRRPLPEDQRAEDHASKLEDHVVDFDDLEAHRALFGVDQIVCALGTTIKQAGSRDRFRQVDHDYPLAMARLGLEHGARHFLLVSSLGADAGSHFFYNRVKGELEDAVRALPYRSLTIAQPSLLLGDRAEFRLGEVIGQRLAFLFPSAYKPVHADAVAQVLAEEARAEKPGLRVLPSRTIRERAHVTSAE